jgi:anaerobic selenocysteine-containing dehydrogenase
MEAALREVPVEDYVARADVPLSDVQRVARDFARAARACVRVDLGTQHTLHCTLNGYLEKLLYLLTGHFGRRGGNNLHTSFLPMLGHTDEGETRPGRPLKRTAYHGMHPIAGMYPPNLLPDEILLAGERRIRAVCVDSSNPALTYADTEAQERAFRSLDLLVVVDVAMTETARLAHYVLPASTQFEKAEATGFTLEFPDNYFHLRHPILPPTPGTLPEPEIYTRLLETMGEIPARFPVLERVARLEPSAFGHLAYLGALAAAMARRPRWRPYAASVVYRSLGPALPEGLAAAAVLLPIAMHHASEHRAAVRRAGHAGKGPLLGSTLFHAVLRGRSGVRLSRHEFEDTWSLVKTPDRRVHLAVPEMLDELRALREEARFSPGAHYPLLLMAGERRAYNANQIYRDPAWRRIDHDGAMRMHQADAAPLGLANGSEARCVSERGEIGVVVQIDDSVRPGIVTLPHGYGQRGDDGQVIGPVVNRLTSTAHGDPLSKTPFHKYVPVRIEPVDPRDAFAPAPAPG